MTRFILLATLFAAVVLAAVVWMAPSTAADFYAEKLRASFFTGLLTVGSFLLSLKVFIVVKFKENVFDSAAYKVILEQRQRINPKIRKYTQIRNLSQVLFASILSALLASACQVTIGLIPHEAAFLFCISAAAFAGAMLLQTLLLIRTILTEWLNHQES